MIKKLDSKIVLEIKERASDIRCSVLNMISKAQVGHLGGSLSAADILATLYFNILNIDPQRPEWPDRDRLIISKGHGATALYSVLALRGYFGIDELKTFGTIGSKLQVHPDKTKVAGVEASTGALGQGLSIGAGVAYAAKLDAKSYRTYVILGDGEIQEGQIWEAAMFASFYKLDNICGIIDCNKLQIDGWVKDVMSLDPLKDKWKSFGWEVIEINGHNFKEIMDAYDKAEKTKGKPTVILAHTIKGKGVSFIENQINWHGIAPKKEELKKAIEELREYK